MRVTIRQKNLYITPALANYIESKLVAPTRKLLVSFGGEGLPVLDLEFSRTTMHHRKGRVFYAEANLSIGKRLMRVTVEGEDIREACDLLKDELERKIKKFKGRAVTLSKRGARRAKKDIRLDRAARMYRKGRIREEGL